MPDWHNFGGNGFTVEDLGRPVNFLLPEKKLQMMINGETVEAILHNFLIGGFGAYTSAKVPSFGFWKDKNKAVIVDECREYEVSFCRDREKVRIPILMAKLAEIALSIGERCIYFKSGQYSCLIRPTDCKKEV